MSITKLPDTAYEVISLLSTQELLSQKEINELIDNRDKKEIKYAIRRLQENHILQIEPNLLDMRSSSYRISTEEELKQAEKALTTEVYNRVCDYIYGNLSTHSHPFATTNA